MYEGMVGLHRLWRDKCMGSEIESRPGFWMEVFYNAKFQAELLVSEPGS
jgi:hypothetical protein